jgi:membrane protein
VNAVTSARVRSRLRLARARLGRLAERSVAEFFDDGCPQSAAAIAYYALFSLFPLVILVVVAFGLVLDDDDAREQVVDFLLDRLPLQPGRGQTDLEQLLRGVTRNGGTLGVVGLLGLLFSASGLMGAIRNALNKAFDATEHRRRPPLQGKALDVLLVFFAGAMIAVSLALTIVTRLAAQASARLDELGAAGETIGSALLSVGQLAPVLLSFAVFSFLYVAVPTRKVRWREVWPGALLAAVGYEVAKTGFSVYLANFGDYSAVYGSLGAIVAFLVFVLLAAMVFLLGGEVAAEWPRVKRAEEADLLAPGEPLRRRLVRLLRGLVVRPDQE